MNYKQRIAEIDKRMEILQQELTAIDQRKTQTIAQMNHNMGKLDLLREMEKEHGD